MQNWQVPCTRWWNHRPSNGGISNQMFQTVIGHLYAGARAYPYVLTQRCNDISFSQVAILAGFNHVCVLSFRFLEERTLEWQQRTNCHASSGDVRFDLVFVKIFSQGMPSQKLLFRKSSPLSGEGWALLVLWISTLVLLFCKQTNCLMWKCLQFWFNIQFCVFLFTLGFFSAKQCCKCGQTLQGSATLMEIHNRWFQASKRCSLEINDQCNALVTVVLFCQHFCTGEWDIYLEPWTDDGVWGERRNHKVNPE